MTGLPYLADRATRLSDQHFCLHGGGGPQVGEVTSLGEVTNLSI